MNMNQVEAEVYAALATATRPLINAELMPLVPTASETIEVSKAIYRLKKAGKIIKAGDRVPDKRTRGTRVLPEYVIAPDDYDAEAAKQAEYQRLADAIEATMTPVSDDEIKTADNVLPEPDAVIAAINAQTAIKAIEDAHTHAARLTALAEWPAMDQSVADWLEDLAQIITDRAAA